MNRWKKLLFLLMVAALGYPLGAVADENANDVHSLDSVVVSATRSETPISDVPQSVTVITREEIMDSPFERIEDILRFAVGFQNTSHYGQQTGGVASHFRMRGVGSNRTLMLLDGVPLNDNFNNSIAWVAWGLIPKETIARIEIVRGPTSAAYGSEGLGGVIHIITKKPRETREASAKFTAGSSETYIGSGLYSQKLSRLSLLLSGGYETSDGLYMADPEDIESYTRKRYRDVGKMFVKAGYELNDRTDLSFSALYYQHEMGKGTDYFYDDLAIDQYRLGMTYKADHMDWSGLVYLNRAEKTANIADTATYNFLVRQEMFPENMVGGAELQNTYYPSDAITLTTGLAYKHIAMDYDEDYPTTVRDMGATGRQDSLSPFVDATARFLDDRLVFNAGLRYDNIRNFDGGSWDTKPPNRAAFNEKFKSTTWENLSPKAGIVFHPDKDSTLRTSIGTGFKAPSLFDLYKVHSRSNWSIRWANPDLEPEEIVTWDIGGERVFFDKLTAKLTYYQSWATDYIGSKTVNSYYVGSKLYTETRYENISEVDIHGVEVELNYDIGYGLTSFFNYTYNISEITKDEVTPALVGKYLTGDPRHKLRTGLTYKNPEIINASISLKYNMDEYQDSLNTTKAPDYLTLDFSIWKKFFDRVTLRMNIENLTDEDDYVEDGTLYYASVQLDF
jgi:iron complex outermembrane receptor protein